MKRIRIIAAGLLLWAAGAPVAAHQDNLTEEMLAYVKRDGLMHLLNAQRYILQEMLVGRREVDQEEFVRAAGAIATMLAMIPSTFERDLTVPESRARPEIWENWDDFVARAEELRKVAEEIAAMGRIHGAQASLEKVRLLSCGGCHDDYRR